MFKYGLGCLNIGTKFDLYDTGKLLNILKKKQLDQIDIAQLYGNGKAIDILSESIKLTKLDSKTEILFKIGLEKDESKKNFSIKKSNVTKKFILNSLEQFTHKIDHKNIILVFHSFCIDWNWDDLYKTINKLIDEDLIKI